MDQDISRRGEMRMDGHPQVLLNENGGKEKPSLLGEISRERCEAWKDASSYLRVTYRDPKSGEERIVSGAITAVAHDFIGFIRIILSRKEGPVERHVRIPVETIRKLEIIREWVSGKTAGIFPGMEKWEKQ